jgi:hypothetical protein
MDVDLSLGKDKRQDVRFQVAHQLCRSLQPPALPIGAAAIAGVRIQDQSVHDTSVGSARRHGRLDEFPLLSCLADLVLVKVDDWDSHQGLYKGIIPGRRRQIRAWWPIWSSDLFHRIARARRHAHRIETLAAWAPHRLHTRAAVHRRGPRRPYTEPDMNRQPDGRPLREKELPDKFASPEYHVLIVAEKYQTGFDQPLLHTMYVDKRLDGVQAVQTLSRLNRTCPGKEDSLGVVCGVFVSCPRALVSAHAAEAQVQIGGWLRLYRTPEKLAWALI